MSNHECRACRSARRGMWYSISASSPPATTFRSTTIRGPTRFTRCRCGSAARCGLAQLLDDPTVPEEPRGAEPAALVAQAADAVARVAAAGLLPAGARVAEYGSPHGGSWLGLLAARGLTPVADGDGRRDHRLLRHDARRRPGGRARRACRPAGPGGVLLLQYHSLDTIIRQGQWNALRHGHYAYYSTTALSAMLAGVGFSPRTAWHFDLYGGTVLLAARRRLRRLRAAVPTRRSGRCSPPRLAPGYATRTCCSGLQRDVADQGGALHDWLAELRGGGRTVLGYGAASRAVALLRKAER